jgi:peroxiredoxin
MKFLGLALTLVMAVALPLSPGENPSAPPASTAPAFPRTDLRTRAAEPPNSTVSVGDVAPNFAFPGPEGTTLSLADMASQGQLLIVFALEERVLTSLEEERDKLLDMGVLPVAIVRERPGPAQSMALRLGLHYPVISDSRRVISAQYNVLDESGPKMIPGWFIVDRQLRVRGLSRGEVALRKWARLAASTLAIPDKSKPLPARSR